MSEDILELITSICAEYEVDGMRGDIVMYKTATTIAAYEDRRDVTADDVREAAFLALLHRQRRQPFQQPELVTEQLDNMIEEFQQRNNQREPHDSTGDDGDQGDADPDLPDTQTAQTKITLRTRIREALRETSNSRSERRLPSGP